MSFFFSRIKTRVRSIYFTHHLLNDLIEDFRVISEICVFGKTFVSFIPIDSVHFRIIKFITIFFPDLLENIFVQLEFIILIFKIEIHDFGFFVFWIQFFENIVIQIVKTIYFVIEFDIRDFFGKSIN